MKPTPTDRILQWVGQFLPHFDPIQRGGGGATLSPGLEGVTSPTMGGTSPDNFLRWDPSTCPPWHTILFDHNSDSLLNMRSWIGSEVSQKNKENEPFRENRTCSSIVKRIL